MAFTEAFASRIARAAIIDGRGVHSYVDLATASARAASALVADGGDLAEKRIALLTQPGFDFAAMLCGIWRAGGIAVPLAVSDPAGALDYIMYDAEVDAVVTSNAFAHVAKPLVALNGVRLRTVDELLAAAPAALPVIVPDRRALIVYSSGTTAQPKGVVSTHAAVAAQVTSLATAWEWVRDDRLLLVLPLHHVHGLINGLCTTLFVGACCEMPPRFDAPAAWTRLASGEISVFTAVPTIYHRLIAAWDAASPDTQRAWAAGVRRVRVMISGSAALPAGVLERWREITGHVLLERYGMTEVGMVLSNPLHGERRPGSVGTPLPSVEVRVVDDAGAPVPDGTPGEIEVRGPTVFLEYWRRPEDTRAVFRDGWFQTGDVAVVEDGAYRILGRRSVDIIKSGGYKISALEIEDAVRGHPAVADCAVVGVEDPSWGERVCAAVELRDDATLTLEELQEWVKARLSPYKVPKDLRCVPALPRNALGKVVKAHVSPWFA
jgi:malonyl-CoA/methylmalonyl-CoA synthetase